MRYASAYLITLQNQIETPVHEEENYYYLTIQYFGNLRNPLNTNSTDWLLKFWYASEGKRWITYPDKEK